jgi:YfiH family protein
LSAPHFRVEGLEGVELLQCVPLAERGVRHGFSLRSGGFGARGKGETDRATLSRAVGLPRLVSMRQVHGNEVRLALDGNGALRCDGLLTDQRRVGLVVESADCVPLLLWAPKVGAVAAVHAGWRGTLARIAGRAVARFQEVKGAAPEDLVAVLGPAIRVCCYEVGDEVISAFAAGGRDPESISRAGPRGRRHLDIVRENTAQLIASGVRPEKVFDSGICTRCENDRFYSFRGEGEGVGRIFGVIGVL